MTTTENRQQIFEEIRAERIRQDNKWGEQNHPDGTGDDRHLLRDVSRPTYGTLCYLAREATDAHADAGTVTWADILLEEVAEALSEQDPKRVRAELVQVAAVTAQWIEAIDRRTENTP